MATYLRSWQTIGTRESPVSRSSLKADDMDADQIKHEGLGFRNSNSITLFDPQESVL